jgi:uncharacterized protein YbjT (DUF2867 family)
VAELLRTGRTVVAAGRNEEKTAATLAESLVAAGVLHFYPLDEVAVSDMAKALGPRRAAQGA